MHRKVSDKLLLNKLCRCKNKESLLEYMSLFDDYIAYNNIPAENIAFTLSILIQGYISVDKLNSLSYEDIIFYLTESIKNEMKTEDLALLIYGLVKYVYELNSKGDN